MGIFDASKISDDQLNIHIQKLRPVQEKRQIHGKIYT